MYDVSMVDNFLRDLSYSHNIDYQGDLDLPENKDYYLTSDKLCICQGECSSWCYVNKDCPSHKKGWTGKYKDCNSKSKYTYAEAEQLVAQTKAQIEEKKASIRLQNEENRRREQEEKIKKKREKLQKLAQFENSIIKTRQDKLLSKQELTETKVLIKKSQQTLNQLKIPAKITMLLQKNRASTFLGRYLHRNQYLQVIIKFLAPEGADGHEAELQKIAAEYEIAPVIYYNFKNKLLIMQYLSIEDGWIPHSEIYKFAEIMNKYIYRNQYDLICEKINILTNLGIDHGSLKGDNIMFNYKNGDVRILDFESAVKSTKTDINTKGTYTHNCAPKKIPIDYTPNFDAKNGENILQQEKL